MANGNYVHTKVKEYGENNLIKNNILYVEGRQREFESFFIDKDGNIERIGVDKDDELNIIQVNLAAIQAAVVAGGGVATDVNPNLPSEAHIKIYVDSLTETVTSDQNSVDKDMVYANFGLVEYRVLDANPIIARYITKVDPDNIENTVHTVFASSGTHPKAVADVKALEEVLTPEDGLVIQVLADLPIISMYVFNTNSTRGVAAGDGTTGYWNRVGSNGYHAKNKLTSSDDVSNSDGTDADKVLDGDPATGWISDAASGTTPQVWHVIPSAGFRPNGYSLERSSYGVFADEADEADEGQPVAWTFNGKLADGTWVELDSRAEPVIKDSGPIFYPLMGIDNDYVEFKFNFLPGDGKKVTISEIKISEIESDDQIGLISADASDVY